MQLRKQLASELERHTQLQLEAEEAQDADGQQGSLDQTQLAVGPHQLVSILKAYESLGYHPSQGLLTATEPFLAAGCDPLPMQQAMDLASLFVSFHWQTGNARTLAEPVGMQNPMARMCSTIRLLMYCLMTTLSSQAHCRSLPTCAVWRVSTSWFLACFHCQRLVQILESESCWDIVCAIGLRANADCAYTEQSKAA